MKMNEHFWPAAVLAGLLAVCAPASARLEQTSAAKDKAKAPLSERGIIAYPTAEELAPVPSMEGAVELQPVSDEGIGTDFSNINDLRWLEPIARGRKVILFGENHYYRNIHNLVNRMLFALNTWDRYPLFLMELQYSISPFLDHYIGLSDDHEAAAFFRETISSFASMEEDRDRLEHIRRWNRTHPDRRIHVGTYDIEHDYMTAVRKILVPFFKSNGRSWPIGKERPSSAELRKILDEMDKAVAGLAKGTVKSPYPFVTPDYIACVIENIRSILNANDLQFDYYRQRAIVRNLTDPRFHGKALAEGKTFIHAGSYHTPTKFPYPDGGNFLREGSFLSYEFGPTRGKTYSIRAEGLTYRLGKMADFDLAGGLPCGSTYRYFVTTMQKAYRDGELSKDGYYGLATEEIKPETLSFYMMLFKTAERSGRTPFLVTRADWDALARSVAEKAPKLAEEILRMKDDYAHYDSLLFIPRSDILVLRPKPAEKAAS